MKSPEGAQREGEENYVTDPAKAEAMARYSSQDREESMKSRREAEDPSWNPDKQEEFKLRAEFLDKRADKNEEGAGVQFETREEIKDMTIEEMEELARKVATEAEKAYREMVAANESEAKDAEEKDRKYRLLQHRYHAIDKTISERRGQSEL